MITLIGVFVGAAIQRIWHHRDEKNRHEEEARKNANIEKNKREEEARKNEEKHNNIKSHIRTECELNVENLKKYNERYLKLKLSRISPSKKINELYLDFYKNLDSFPISSHKTWDNSNDSVKEIFRDDQIKRIMEFYTKYDILKEKSKNLHEKSKNDEFVRNILQNKYSNEINETFKDILNFEGEINDLIVAGEIILHFLNL